MKLRIALAVSTLLIAAAGAGHEAAAFGLGEAAELEAARANARAGGPVSSRDRELLERYGCLSGTNNPVCRPRTYSYDQPVRKRKRKQQ